MPFPYEWKLPHLEPSDKAHRRTLAAILATDLPGCTALLRSYGRQVASLSPPRVKAGMPPPQSIRVMLASVFRLQSVAATRPVSLFPFSPPRLVPSWPAACRTLRPLPTSCPLPIAVFIRFCLRHAGFHRLGWLYSPFVHFGFRPTSCLSSDSTPHMALLRAL